MEVTLQESTAANPEYADFLCASRPTAAGLFHRGWGVFLTLLLDAMGRQSVHQLPNTQDNSQPSVHTLIFKNDDMQKCGGKQKITLQIRVAHRLDRRPGEPSEKLICA